jgi:hypothetical protein
VENTSFTTFCETAGIKFDEKYRMVRRNLAASFQDASKYDVAQPVLDLGAWLLAGEWVKEAYSSCRGSRVMGRQEVIDAMDMTTSCGYPHNLVFHNKQEMSETQSWEILEDYWDNISVGTFTEYGSVYSPDRIMPIFCVSQKVELRDTEKLALNKIRTFTASPVEHSYAANRLCLDMNLKFYDTARNARELGTWSFVGATKFLSGWDDLYKRLSRAPTGTENLDVQRELHQQFKRNAIELDESRFDSSLFRAAMFGQCEIRWDLLRFEDKTPENKVRLWNIYEALVDTVMVLENGELVQKGTGNPSGGSNTIVDNTMILERLLAYAWIILCRAVERETSFGDFRKHVEAALNGDDNTYTTTDEVKDLFSATKIAEVWSGIGVKTTTPCWTVRPLEECCFLSQGFDFDKELNQWLPTPAEERVLSSMKWGSNIDDVRWHFMRACALRIDAWGNVRIREILTRYLEFLLNTRRDELVGECQGLKIKHILAGYKSDAWIKALYGGRESTNAGNLQEIEDMLEQLQRVL